MELQNNPNQESMMGRVAGAGLMPIIFFGIISIAFGIVLALVLPALNILPPQASEQAQRTDALFTILMGLGGVVFFLVQGLIYYSAIRFRAKANDVSDGPPIHGNVMLEIVWTVIPSFVVVLLSVISFVVWSQNTATSDTPNQISGQTVDINAYGQRFAWSFEYLTNATDINDEPIVLTSSDLHVYVGQDVELAMETRDVIHSFWVPALRVKQDLLPGRVTTIVFNPIDDGTGWDYANVISPVTLTDATGETVFEIAQEGISVRFGLANPDVDINAVDRVDVIAPNGEQGTISASAITGRYNRYRLNCAELCGGGHGDMYGWVNVHESEAAMLAGWYALEVTKRYEPPADPVLLGEQILTSGKYPCANCHVLDSLGWNGNLGPALNGIASRADSRANSTGNANGAEYIAQSIRRPNSFIVSGYDPNIMNYFGNTDEAPAAAAAFLQMPQEDLIGIVAYLCTQSDDGEPTSSDCGLENWAFEDDALTDVDAVVEELQNLSNTYQE